jgi:hypothetical protein
VGEGNEEGDEGQDKEEVGEVVAEGVDGDLGGGDVVAGGDCDEEQIAEAGAERHDERAESGAL